MRSLVAKAAALFIGTAAAFGPALAQPAASSADPYPTRPIRLVVPYAPGGTTDVLARLVANEMSKHLGQAVVVENKAGAGTIIGTTYVAKAPPDGYTLLLGVNTAFSSNPLLFKSLSYRVDDFRPVALLSMVPMVLSTSVSNPAGSLRQLVDESQKRPGGLSFGTLGKGSSVHLVAELIALKTGMRMTPVPYKGSGPALTAVMSGEVDLYADAVVTSIPLIDGGKIKPIAISSQSRSPLYPNLPTFEEAGIKGGTIHVWFAIMAPRNVPDAIVDKLNTVVNQVLESPQLRTRFSAEGALVERLSPQGLQNFIDRETKAWAEVIAATKIQLD